MHNTKVLLAVASFGSALAQTSTRFPDPGCSSSIYALIAAAPTTPPEVDAALTEISPSFTIPAEDLLSRPSVYASELCSIATQLPAPVLSKFGTWGSELLAFAATEIASYDWIVTMCHTTGEAASSITSYLHSIASNPGELCKVEANHTNGTTSTPYPTPTGNETTTSTGLPISSVSLAGASMPTGFPTGAAAIGGLLGAVALL
ncbi:hypothetical protein F5B22DRAFT_662231 [Xylaria bambusicola]|uniref:uncharacterized protein n=1 Tax=Xylaria bambusicola TaxID=326684 RepID=UPI002008BC41|nr:uncharacterized protein F5B22DRAFT_662231 [Xylaria bambusicola]KAI0503213.1 hypothetical protein F5B22DRAFT_662231 [Xylaria bambusicola]